MPSPDNALQAGIYARLNGYAPLVALIGANKVYDFVPERAQPPYVLIGEDTLVDNDSKSNPGWDATLTIHCWDYERAGRKSVKAILSAIHDALHWQTTNITVAGYQLVHINREFQDTIQETAGEGQTDRYWHGVARYRALIHA